MLEAKGEKKKRKVLPKNWNYQPQNRIYKDWSKENFKIENNNQNKNPLDGLFSRMEV